MLLNKIIIIISMSVCFGEDLQENLNEYLFEKQNFHFVDLTMSLTKGFDHLSEPQRDVIQAMDNKRNGFSGPCENEWRGTSLNFRGKQTNSYGLKTIEELPLQRFIVPLIIADISSKVSNDSNFVLQKHHLDYFLNNYFGKTEQPCFIVFKFGWTRYKHNAKKYFGLEETTNAVLKTPGISGDVAKWITTAYKNIVGVGVDLPTVDPGISSNYSAYDTFINAGVYVVENVAVDEYIPDAWCTSILLPLTIKTGRVPARLVAICPKSRMNPQELLWHQI